MGTGLRGLLGAAKRTMLSSALNPPSVDVPLTPFVFDVPLGTAEGAIVYLSTPEISV